MSLVGAVTHPGFFSSRGALSRETLFIFLCIKVHITLKTTQKYYRIPCSKKGATKLTQLTKYVRIAAFG